MRRYVLSGLIFLFSVIAPASVQAGTDDHAGNILVSNKPLALIAAAVYPAERISVLIPDGMSPHDYSLKPSDIRRIRSAGTVIWTGNESEPFLTRFAGNNWISAGDLMRSLNMHTGDPHVWLSPELASALAKKLAGDNAQQQKKAAEFAGRIGELTAHHNQRLIPMRNKGFYVFHQAYDYWFDALGISQSGAFALSPEYKPGAKTIQKIRNTLQQGDAQCVLSEPQYSPAIIHSVTRGLDIREGSLDPVAGGVPVSASGYAEWLNSMAETLYNCLKN